MHYATVPRSILAAPLRLAPSAWGGPRPATVSDSARGPAGPTVSGTFPADHTDW